MKISLNWLKEYLTLDLSEKEISDKLTQLGLESTFSRSSKTFKGIVLGKVLTCDPHPNADKLSICKVEIDDAQYLEIVCGM